ncbi:MAG TPA: site-2 protease family protein [Polyangiaceae bacterium]
MSAGAAAPSAGGAPRVAWRTNAWLFLATVASCLVTQWPTDRGWHAAALQAAGYTVALLAILLCHEFGHYIAARIHRVDASLPYFIPLPILSPFGTMGAVIRMRSVIPTRRALLDIGAAGPLAGLVVAIPVYIWGIAHSKVIAPDLSGGNVMEFGESLLTKLIEHVFGPSVPEGMDIELSPVAFAGWAGMFVTMINLLPVGQLDGGHVAYSLFGPRQNRIAQWVHRSMLAFFFVSVVSFVARDVRSGIGLWHLGRHVQNSLFWLVWFEVLPILGSFSTGGGPDRLGVRTRAFAILGLALLAGFFHDRTSILLWVAWFAGLAVLLVMEARWGALRNDSTLLDHPATGAEPLRAGRVAVAIITLAFFALLFMPTPISM